MSKPSKNPARKATKTTPRKPVATTEVEAMDAAPPTTPKPPHKATVLRPRDPRLPKAGTVLQRAWHGKTYEVKVDELDFTFKGKSYRSLTALARKITGARSINGVAWWRLATRPAPKQEEGT